MTGKYNQLFYFSLSLPPPHQPTTTAHQELPDDIRANLTEELPQPRDIPRKLSEYTQEEIDAFPRLWTPYVEHAQIQAESINRGSMQASVSMKHNCTGRCEPTIVHTQAPNHLKCGVPHSSAAWLWNNLWCSSCRCGERSTCPPRWTFSVMLVSGSA